MHLKENILSADLTLVFRALPGLYLLLSPDFIILDATELYSRTTNFKIDEVIGKSIFDTFPDNPTDSNAVAKRNLRISLEEVTRSKAPHTLPLIQFDVPTTDSGSRGFEEHFWKTTNTPILDSKGEIVYILHATQNITASVRQDKINQQNQERLAMLDSALHTVAWEYDIVNDRLSWSESLLEVFGHAPDMMDPGGKSWDDLVHPEDFTAVQKSIEDAMLEGKKLWTNEYRLRRADGTYAHVLDQGYHVYDANGKPLRTFGTIIDLSHSKRSEAELKESDTRFRQLLENLPHMAWTADPNGKVLFFNENWYNYTGMPKGQTHGWTSYIHPEDTADALTAWHNAVSSQTLYEIEYRIRDCIDGSYRYFMERGVPMYNQEGNVILWVGTYTDIEDQKRTLEQIRLKDQQLESILQHSPSHLCLLEGPNHICRYVSPGVYRLYGNRSYIGRPAREIWPEFTPMGFMDLLDQVYMQGSTAQISELQVMYDRYQNGNPKEAFFNFRYQATFTNFGQVEGVLITATEVTELVRAKRKAEALALELQKKEG
ncbi:PAS domain-containing protein [uncultured Pontibacter sp.]|uniref:PAS domain-containing protein n=1 Tax=uncultured Pontibacter sp. TaxID=453356 RepID=UPI002616C5B3|nr:PAS domain-containing protein [uncultured Pontibacter sp.]